MPIRINLLADQQAAEESRRRDPIKRVIFGGCAVLVLLIGLIITTQMQVWAARHELTQQNAKLEGIDKPSKQVKNKQVASLDAAGRLHALERYSGTRFFWGTFLDALQHVTVDNIRLIEVRAEQKYVTTETKTLFSTNLIVNYTPPPAGWKFWAAAPAQTPISMLVSNMLGSVTNSAIFATNKFAYSIKVTETATNVVAHQVVALVEFNLGPRAVEKTTIEIRGRDYGTDPGAALDQFAKRLTSSPYFKGLLNGSQGFRFTERPPQARPDPQDPANPTALFVPFTIELTLDERTFTNEQNL